MGEKEFSVTLSLDEHANAFPNRWEMALQLRTESHRQAQTTRSSCT